MNETRRFLRYVTPGLVFATESLALTWLLAPQLVTSSLARLDDSGKALGAAVGTLLLSGGIGFTLSVVHHQWHWLWDRAPIDLRPWIQNLRDTGVIVLNTRSGEKWAGTLNRLEAWTLTSILWDERLSTSTLLLKFEANVDGLNDLFHSIGAARVASFLSPAIVAILLLNAEAHISSETWDRLRGLGAVIGAAAWMWVLWRSHQRLGQITSMTLRQALTDALISERNDPRTPDGPIPIAMTFPGSTLMCRKPIKRQTEVDTISVSPEDVDTA